LKKLNAIMYPQVSFAVLVACIAATQAQSDEPKQAVPEPQRPPLVNAQTEMQTQQSADEGTNREKKHAISKYCSIVIRRSHAHLT
jgi:hypothetical protein